MKEERYDENACSQVLNGYDHRLHLHQTKLLKAKAIAPGHCGNKMNAERDCNKQSEAGGISLILQEHLE